MKKTAMLLLTVFCFLFTLTCGAESTDSWICENCAAVNDMNFCTYCGAKRPDWICSTCGTRCEASANFCGICGSGKSLAGEKDPIVQNALDLIVDAWNQEYIQAKESGRDIKPYLQIIYTRQFDIIPGSDSAEKFLAYYPETASVIVFDMHSDYLGDEPVYDYSGFCMSVIVKKDGTMEVQQTPPFRIFRGREFITDFRDWVTVKDYGGLYNGVYID